MHRWQSANHMEHFVFDNQTFWQQIILVLFDQTMYLSMLNSFSCDPCCIAITWLESMKLNALIMHPDSKRYLMGQCHLVIFTQHDGTITVQFYFYTLNGSMEVIVKHTYRKKNQYSCNHYIFAIYTLYLDTLIFNTQILTARTHPHQNIDWVISPLLDIVCLLFMLIMKDFSSPK